MPDLGETRDLLFTLYFIIERLKDIAKVLFEYFTLFFYFLVNILFCFFVLALSVCLSTSEQTGLNE